MSAQNPRAQANPEEFVVKVNDIIEATNRIARRTDIHYAESVLLHAFAHYCAHHYRTTPKLDSQEQREAFLDYITGTFRGVLDKYVAEMNGPLPSASGPGETEPSAE